MGQAVDRENEAYRQFAALYGQAWAPKDAPAATRATRALRKTKPRKAGDKAKAVR